MKSRHYWKLLKFELDWCYASKLMVIPLGFAFSMGSVTRSFISSFGWGLGLGVAGGMTVFFVGVAIIIMNIGLFPFAGPFMFSRVTPQYPLYRSLEFPFSSAISRETLYWSKCTIFGAFTLFPVLPFGLACLICGQAEAGFLLLILGAALAAAFQAIFLGSRRMPWARRFASLGFLLGLLISIPLPLFWMREKFGDHGAPGHPAFLPWVRWNFAHPGWFLLAAGFVIVFSLRLGRRQFVQQEVLA